MALFWPYSGSLVSSRVCVTYTVEALPALSITVVKKARPPLPSISATPIVNAPTDIASAVSAVRALAWRRFRPARRVISILLIAIHTSFLLYITMLYKVVKKVNIFLYK